MVNELSDRQSARILLILEWREFGKVLVSEIWATVSGRFVFNAKSCVATGVWFL